MDALVLKEKIRKNQNLQKLYKGKVFWEPEHIPLFRKTYRGKRDKDGHRKNEIYYVNSSQEYRIREETLDDYVSIICKEAKNIDTCVEMKCEQARKDEFLKMHESIVREKRTEDRYKDFISEYLNQSESQLYKNYKVEIEKEKDHFKDIIEKIEVYETGVLCIFNNGFEISVQFEKGG